MPPHGCWLAGIEYAAGIVIECMALPRQLTIVSRAGCLRLAAILLALVAVHSHYAEAAIWRLLRYWMKAGHASMREHYYAGY